MCGILHISKEMLIQELYLIVYVHKSRKRTIQSWISIPQKWAMIFIHNAVKKMHKCNWGHSLRWRHNESDGFSNHQPYAYVYSIVYSGADQRKHQSSASLAFVRGIRRWPVNSSHNGPVTRKMFPFIMNLNHGNLKSSHWLQNRCQCWQHISSYVKFGITCYHYYHICFYTPQCNHKYG